MNSDVNLQSRIRDYLNGMPAETRRLLRDVQPVGEGRIRIGSDEIIDFASNDYLGIAGHPKLIEASCEWTRRYGAGSRASRLISGNLEALTKLEEKIARVKGADSVLVFGSGFQANSSILAALVDHRLVPSGQAAVQVFSDRQCHASFHFGFAAGGVRQNRFRHNDLGHLEQLIQDRAVPDAGLLIATESIFSMDGDQLDVEGIRHLANRYGAMLYVDEAHATGVTGPGGMGAMAGSPRENEIIVGTFGKALGSYGSYVACSREIREYLVNRCAGLIYSTALPPSVLGSIDAAIELMPTLQDSRAHLQQLAHHLRTELAECGFDTLRSTTQIVPVMIHDNQTTLNLAKALLEEGFLVGAIRPPTVAVGTARLRVSLSAAHTREQIDSLVEAIRRLASREETR